MTDAPQGTHGAQFLEYAVNCVLCGAHEQTGVDPRDVAWLAELIDTPNSLGFEGSDGEVIDLAKDERRFAEVSAKRCHQFVCRRRHAMFWVGLVFVALGYPIVGLPDWAYSILHDAGFFLLILAGLGMTMSATGKLYEHVQRLDAPGSERA